MHHHTSECDKGSVTPYSCACGFVKEFLARGGKHLPGAPEGKGLGKRYDALATPSTEKILILGDEGIAMFLYMLSERAKALKEF